MLRLLLLFCALPVLPAGAGSGGERPAPQQPVAPKATFRADVSEVRVDVQVLDGKKIITGLGPADFQITDEGQPQTLLRFGEEAEPVALVILIDVSGSMKKYARQLASTAQSALQHLKPQDRVSVMVFSRGTELLSEFSSSLEEVAREIEVGVEQHRLPSGTAIYNSVLEASRLLATDKDKNLASRRAVLILTDNASLNYQITEAQVLRELWGVDAVLNALVTDSAERPKLVRPGAYRNPDFVPTDIFKLADQTGGEAYQVDRADRAFPQIMERLRSRYTVIYRPPPAPPGVLRSIKVELSPAARRRYPGARIRTRAGYYTAE
ncbi:MAG: VWA domain-containing protein [Acidobacteria bacterium]|nr:VWA domain-containing protein [Acidobacteriota bacterium]